AAVALGLLHQPGRPRRRGPGRASGPWRLSAPRRRPQPHVGRRPPGIPCSLARGRAGRTPIHRCRRARKNRPHRLAAVRDRAPRIPPGRHAGHPRRTRHRLPAALAAPAGGHRSPAAGTMERNHRTLAGAVVPLFGGHVQWPSHPLRSSLRHRRRRLSRPGGAWPHAGHPDGQRISPRASVCDAAAPVVPRVAAAYRARAVPGCRPCRRTGRGRPVGRTRRHAGPPGTTEVLRMSAGIPVRPLDGITVVSLEHAIAAPFCTRQLADMGARVIKIERPGTGDFARGYDERVRGLSSHFVWTNRSKESLTLDLKHPDAADVMRRLLESADVLVQNLAPGAAERLGLSFEALHARHPRLIVCDISGYGEGGPYERKKAYDLLIQSESGFVSVTGSPDDPA